MEQITALMKKAEDVLRENGLELVTFAIMPNVDPNGHHVVQLVASIGEDAFKTAEQKQIDDQFREIALRERHEQKQKEVEEAAAAAKASLEDLMNDGGIGLDFDDDDDS